MKLLWPVLIGVAMIVASSTTAAAGNPKVKLSTSLGDITIELYADKAPATVQNFLGYVDDGFYNETVFHRVVPNFVIQGGGFTATMERKKTKPPIKNEAGNGLKNDVATVAMARTSAVDSATSQFFINCKDNDFLNHKGEAPAEFGYAVFGKVVEGMDVVRKIEKTKTTAKGPHRDIPVDPVIIKSVKRVQ